MTVNSLRQKIQIRLCEVVCVCIVIISIIARHPRIEILSIRPEGHLLSMGELLLGLEEAHLASALRGFYHFELKVNVTLASQATKN